MAHILSIIRKAAGTETQHAQKCWKLFGLQVMWEGNKRWQERVWISVKPVNLATAWCAMKRTRDTWELKEFHGFKGLCFSFHLLACPRSVAGKLECSDSRCQWSHTPSHRHSCPLTPSNTTTQKWSSFHYFHNYWRFIK